SSTTTSVPTPPITTEGTVPNHAAVTPDSNSPSWFDEPMNTELTALTRPRISSGVCSWTSDDRITTLTMSDAPSSTSAASESGSDAETAKTIVATPNTPTAANILRPMLRPSGWCAR